jgi:hypothetical protein
MRPTQEGGIHQESTGAQQETRGREEPQKFEICIHTEGSCHAGAGARENWKNIEGAQLKDALGMR